MPAAKTADEWTAAADRLRDETLQKVIFRGAAAGWRDAKAKVEWLETVDGGPGYRIKKVRYEAVPGLWIPALLYEPENLTGKVPVVLNVNGHDGQGKAAEYKQIRCINQARRGMLALNVEWFGMGQLRGAENAHPQINAIDLCGTSGIATHFLYLRRALDLLLAHEHADPARVAVTGLSGGGWQTIFISGLDPRVTLCDPVAGYSSFFTRARHFSDLGDSEQTPCDLATVVDYTHLTAMRAPRPTLLTFNAKDNCCFAAGHALPPLVEAAAPKFALFGMESNLRTHVNEDPGDHNFGLDNRLALYRMLGDHFFPGDAAYPRDELPTDGQIRTADELKVELPADNASLRSLAVDLARDLPRRPDRPAGRDDLRALVRPIVGDVRAEEVGRDEADGLTAVRWRLRVGDEWSVPAVEFRRGEPTAYTILLADAGRAGLAAEVKALLDDGRGVLALDPFYFGEARVKERDSLFALLIAAVGERPLGVQAGQVAAVGRWLAKEKGKAPTVAAIGPRTGVVALAAAALEPEAVAAVRLRKPLGSLKELIDDGRGYQSAPELFCFGLLEAFDIPDLAALVAPRPVERIDAGPSS